MNEGKCFSNQSNSSWRSMSFVVAGDGQELGVDPARITTSSPVEQKESSSTNSLAVGVDEGAVAGGRAREDYEVEPFSALVFPFLAGGDATSRASYSFFFCCLSQKLTCKLVVIYLFIYFFSSLIMGRTTRSRASLCSTPSDTIASLDVVA